MKRAITRKEFNELTKIAKDALSLASRHDPDHEHRLEIIERQLERLYAPQYRELSKGVRAERKRKK